MKKPYKDFAEWRVDMLKVRENPDDKAYLAYVRGRYFASSKDLQEEVKEYLESYDFEKNPMQYAAKLAKQTGSVVYSRTKEDPWWSV